LKNSLSPKEFKHLFDLAKNARCKHLTFKYAKTNISKIGFVVSKKYGNAIGRNKLKRRCRELFANNIVNKNLNISVIVFPNKENIKYKNLESDFLYFKEIYVNNIVNKPR
tara:strand:- start:1384 stop:1713 length:330 start_codon:yes stop_codon:yes gene_type:complete